MSALEFHHRDGADKAFSIGGAIRGWERLWTEAAKCDLLCASCHRLRHTAATDPRSARVRLRRETKIRAVESFGGRCAKCGRDGPAALFEFHHRDPKMKAFGIGYRGLWRPWHEVKVELLKCDMLCPNCHRETHSARRREVATSGPLTRAVGLSV